MRFVVFHNNRSFLCVLSVLLDSIKMSRKIFLGRARAFGSDCLDEEVQQKVMVQDDDVFTNRMTGLNALWSDLLEQKKFNSTLREQLQCSIENQLLLEAILNEREEQLQHEFDKVYATRKKFSTNIENEPVAANNTTASSGYQQKHVWQRQCDDGRSCEEIQKVSSDNEQPHELPEHLRLSPEHAMQLKISPPKEQTRLKQTRKNRASESNDSGFPTAHNPQNHYMELDADGALSNHQMEEVVTPPGTANPMDNSDQSESVIRLNQCENQLFGKRSNASFKDVRAELDKRSCPECGKLLSRKSNLWKHLKIHTGEKPYKCPDCDAAFNLSSNLAAHRRTHSDRKPFACDICKKSFREKLTLTQHMNLHSGLKPLKCNVCEGAFSHRIALWKHRKIHGEVGE